MKKGNNISVLNKIWDFFASIKLAIIIFAVISLISIIGTIVEQQADADKNVTLLAKFFGESAAPDIYNIFATLGFIDMYRSWWYIAIIVLLALNIIVCSIDRLPGTLKIIKRPLSPLSDDMIKKMPIIKSALLEDDISIIKGTVRTKLSKAGFNLIESADDSGFRFYSQRGCWSRLGAYIIHLGVIVIMIGVISGMVSSEESFISLPEGDTSSVTYPIPGSGRTDPIPLGFEIRCDNFEVVFYENTEKPKSFKSKVAILEDGREILRKTVQVNDPLKYKGTTFYLSDYNTLPGRLNKGTFIFRVTTKDGQSVDVRLRPGNILQIPGTSITGKILNFSPALFHDEEGNLSTSTDKLHNPAVHLEFTDSGRKLYSNWIFKRFPETSYLPDGNRVEFVDYWGVEYTFFRIRKDPGYWLVYTGLVTMGIGLIIAFFMSHKKIWVNLIEKEGNTRVLIGASANKYISSFGRKIDRLINSLR